jgi:hypothetical protein
MIWMAFALRCTSARGIGVATVLRRVVVLL